MAWSCLWRRFSLGAAGFSGKKWVLVLGGAAAV